MISYPVSKNNTPQNIRERSKNQKRKRVLIPSVVQKCQKLKGIGQHHQNEVMHILYIQGLPCPSFKGFHVLLQIIIINKTIPVLICPLIILPIPCQQSMILMDINQRFCMVRIHHIPLYIVNKTIGTPCPLCTRGVHTWRQKFDCQTIQLRCGNSMQIPPCYCIHFSLYP